ncbi:MAG: cupin domain-containing protein [Saprospiraceae bacterium]|nr:cupin domain-containing protein [Saprospiraceae bacterium]
MSGITFPHTIKNTLGESITFKGLITENGTEKIILEASVAPGSGPAMHVHYKQDECLKVTKGKMGYQLLGQEPQFINAGEEILFPKGIPHRFWNATEEDLLLEGWVSPPNTFLFFLSTLYAAQAKSGRSQPDAFVGAYLLTRYRNEYDMLEIPGFVRKVIMPLTVFIGNLLGKYKAFKDAPEPV